MFGQGIPVKRSSRQTMIKLYAQAVISELQQLIGRGSTQTSG